MEQRRTAPRVLSLYSGAGGLDLGLEAAGFETRLCVEVDEDARSTLKANRPNWTLATPGDIHKQTPEALLRQGGFDVGEVDLLAGGPPCQPFSKSGYWSRGDSQRLRDPRAATLQAYLDVVETAQPRVVLLENVRGLTYEGKAEGVDLLVKGIDAINRRKRTRYRVSLFLLNAADFGVPQLRERVFLIADREGRLFSPPSATHGSKFGLQPYLTAWDAIGDLANQESDDLCVSGKWAALLPSIPEGHNYLWHTPEGGGTPLFGWRTRFWSFLLKLSKRRPSWTILADPGPATGPFHWNSRRLSTRELCRLQTIPDNYVIHGDRRSVQRQLGNAVPCALAQTLGLAIRRQLLGDHRARTTTTLIPARARRTPPAVSVARVPRQFSHLKGNHSRHGGTGKGPLAQKLARVENLSSLRIVPVVLANAPHISRARG